MTGDDGVDRGEGTGETGSGGSGSILPNVRQWTLRGTVLRGGALLAAFALVCLVAFVPAGILGLVINDSATFEAAPAAPDDETVAEAGYELQTADEVTVEQQISAGGQDRTIVVNNQRRTYERTVDVQNRSFNAGVFVTLSTPAVSVAGSAQNPIAEMAHEAILERFGEQLTDGPERLEFERVGTRQASMLGESIRVGEFRTNVTVDGQQRDVAVYVTRVRSGDDVVVAVGVHPTAFPGDRVSIFRMIHAVEHPSE